MNLKKMYKMDCRLFTGYKPCQYKRKDCRGCEHYASKGTMILLIHLEAMGAVLQTTALLRPLKRKYPVSTVYWVTDPASVPLLENNPLVDMVLPFGFETFISLRAVRFDLVLNVDKSRKAAGLAMAVSSGKKSGFRMDRHGALLPFDRGSHYHYLLGLDDELKFRKNTKTIPEYLAESFGLLYNKDEYILELSRSQKDFVKGYRQENGLSDRDLVIGFNTGCSELYPNKKLDVAHITELARRIHGEFPGAKIALFGGRAETERNAQIAASLPFPVLNTPTTQGLRKGMAVMEIADIIVTGDTLGMHIGIGLKKRIVAWFNVSCSREIELYGRGEKVLSRVECSPCWKRECSTLVCFERIELNEIYEAVKREIARAGTLKDTGHQAETRR